MTAPKIVVTVLTVVAVGASPAVASAASKPNDINCSSWYCGGSSNHNEVMTASSAA